ncbi:hypothetical protein YTPLAS73_09090 [Nitrosarchaeum sp.]|nr:hypothetical protein YTPLAS73_09090 [Nitrosarchaeum sp.]
MLEELNKKFSKLLWNRAVKQRFGFGPEHLTMYYSAWNFAKWPLDETYDYFVNNHKKGIENYDKLIRECNSTDRNTTIRPKLVNKIYPKINGLPNIITSNGLLEIAKSRTGESTKTNTHMVFGSGTASEALSDTQLESQMFAKSFDADGARTVETSTNLEKYLMPVLPSDDTPPFSVTECGIATGASPPTDILISRVTFNSIQVDTDDLLTVLVTIGHENGT